MPLDLELFDSLMKVTPRTEPDVKLEMRAVPPAPLTQDVEESRLQETAPKVQQSEEMRDKFIDLAVTLGQHPEGLEVVDTVKQAISDPSFFDKLVLGPLLYTRTRMMEAHSEGFLERPGEMLREVENVPGYSLITPEVSAQPKVGFFEAPKQGLFSGGQSKGIIEEWLKKSIDSTRSNTALPKFSAYMRGLQGLDEAKLQGAIKLYQDIEQLERSTDPSTKFAGAAQFTAEAALDLFLDPLMVFTSLPKVFFVARAGSALKPWQHIKVLSRAEAAAIKAAGDALPGIQIAGYGTFAEAAKKIAAGGFKSAEAALRLSLAPFPTATREKVLLGLGDSIRKQRMSWAKMSRWVDQEAFFKLLPPEIRANSKQLARARIQADQKALQIAVETPNHIFKHAGTAMDKVGVTRREFIARLVDEGVLPPRDTIRVAGGSAGREGVLSGMEELVGAISTKTPYTPPQAGIIQRVLEFARSTDSAGKALRFPEVSKMTNREILALAADARRVQDFAREIAVAEVEAGILNNVRQVYLPRIFRNQSKLRELLELQRTSLGKLADRSVDDLAMLRAMEPFMPFAKARTGAVGSIAQAKALGLDPITDAMTLLQIRQYHYLVNRNQQVYYREMLKQIGGDRYVEVANQVRKEFAAQGPLTTLTKPGMGGTIWLGPHKETELVLAADFAKGRPLFAAAVKQAAKDLGVQPKSLYLPEPLAREFAGTLARARTPAERNAATQMMLNAWDAQMAFFKLLVTSPHSGFHFTNILGDTERAWIDVGAAFLNPRTWRQIEAILANDSTKIIPVAGKNYTAAELRSLSNNLGSFRQKYDIEEVRAGGLPAGYKSASDYGRQAGNIATLGTGHLGTIAGEMWEERMRRALFLTFMKKGFTPELAREEVYRVLFNVADGLTAVEKAVFRRAFPFYSFWKFNAEFHIKALGYTPGRIATFEKLAQVKGAGIDDNTWKDLIQPWEQSGTTFPTRLSDGTIRTTTLRTTASEWWNRLPKNLSADEMNRVFLSEGMFNVAPMIKAGIQLVTKTDPVTGKEIGLRAYSQNFRLFETAPQLLRDAIGFNNTEQDTDTGKVRYSINPYAYAAMTTMGFSRAILGAGKLSRAGITTPFDVLNAAKEYVTGAPFVGSYLSSPDIRKIDAILSVGAGQATVTLDELEKAKRAIQQMAPQVEKMKKMKQLLERQGKIGSPVR